RADPRREIRDHRRRRPPPRAGTAGALRRAGRGLSRAVAAEYRRDAMRWSDERILTTHTGSLPRPPELTRLYVRRARGESVDAAELERLGHDALRWVVRKQAEAGVDLGNNGEQQREGFFLHIRHRMSGFGGSWQRRTRADALRYPVFK